MTAHVFIVNEQTFPLHLNYLFVGVGAGARNEWIPLLADVKRVRPKDKVIFYLEGVGFYGIFEIADTTPLIFKDYTYLLNELGKKLIYRALINPYEVYPDFVSEWEALEKLPADPRDIIWSLIYRKLKGARGCTPIFDEEFKKLVKLLRESNNSRPLHFSNSDGFSWDVSSKRIIVVPNSRIKYGGARNATLNLLQEIIKRAEANRSFEYCLQAYFTENIGIDSRLDQICGGRDELIWIGNEVFCGVGMQKIDIFTITKKNDNKVFRIIELKDEEIEPSITNQLLRYINWVSYYLKDATSSNIQPIIVAPNLPDKNNANSLLWNEVINVFNDFNSKNLSRRIKYFEYEIQPNTIMFNEIQY
jgi:hypothetical protein